MFQIFRRILISLFLALLSRPADLLAAGQPSASIKGPVVWQFATGKEVTAAPVVEGGVLFCGSMNGTFFAIDAETGQLLWKFAAPYPISSRAALHKNSVCFESGNNLIALDRNTGRELWRYVAKPYRPIFSLDLTDYHRSSPVIADEVVYYGDDWGNLNGVDASSGKLAFQFTTETARPIRCTPAIEKGVVFFGDWEGDVYAVSLTGGKLIWKHRAENVRPYYGAVVSEFRIHEGAVYFGSQHDTFAPLDAVTGRPIWSYTDPNHTYLPSTPLINDGKVIVGTTVFTNSVICLDRGNPVWSLKLDGIFFTTPIKYGSTLIINSTNFGGTGFLYFIDIANGKLIDKLPIEKATPSAPAIAAGKIYLGAGDGNIYALSLKQLCTPADVP